MRCHARAPAHRSRPPRPPPRSDQQAPVLLSNATPAPRARPMHTHLIGGYQLHLTHYYHCTLNTSYLHVILMCSCLRLRLHDDSAHSGHCRPQEPGPRGRGLCHHHHLLGCSHGAPTDPLQEEVSSTATIMTEREMSVSVTIVATCGGNQWSSLRVTRIPLMCCSARSTNDATVKSAIAWSKLRRVKELSRESTDIDASAV